MHIYSYFCTFIIVSLHHSPCCFVGANSDKQEYIKVGNSYFEGTKLCVITFACVLFSYLLVNLHYKDKHKFQIVIKMGIIIYQQNVCVEIWHYFLQPNPAAVIRFNSVPYNNGVQMSPCPSRCSDTCGSTCNSTEDDLRLHCLSKCPLHLTHDSGFLPFLCWCQNIHARNELLKHKIIASLIPGHWSAKTTQSVTKP